MLKIFLLFSLVVLVSCSSVKNAKNVVYFVGDGMGPAYVTGARIYKGGSKAKLNLESLEFVGLSRTYSTDKYVTDSAASATALATGVKSYNKSIGMSDPKTDPSKTSRKLQTLADLAFKEGKSIGFVTTTRISHATPASFYAHVAKRDEEVEIANQLVDSPFHLFMGGGSAVFLPKSAVDSESGRNGYRSDDRNLIEEIKNRGDIVVQNQQEFEKLDPHTDKKIFGLFNYSHMEYEDKRHADKAGEPSIKEMVEFALKYLSKNPKGYFLLVEGGRIDHAGHKNIAKNAFVDLIAFDDSIGMVLDQKKKNTLVVVTADHETGGLSLLGYGNLDHVKGEALLVNKVDNGKMDPKDSFISWGSGPGYHSKLKANPKEKYRVQKATYDRDSAAHSAVDVMVGASGPGANQFTGFMDNNEIAKKIAESMGLNFTDKVNLENMSK